MAPYTSVAYRLRCVWLETQGLAKVHWEDLALTLAEQILAFAGARVIMSPHGAGLANLVFCRADTRVVELFNHAYFNPCFWHPCSAARAGLPDSDVIITGIIRV